MYKLNYFVPLEAKEKTKEALFSLGAGAYENYIECSWESLGVGQFRPLKGANPHLGVVGELERVEEYKVEMLCSDALIAQAIQTLKEVHPYEEVAYEVFKMEEF